MVVSGLMHSVSYLEQSVILSLSKQRGEFLLHLAPWQPSYYSVLQCSSSTTALYHSVQGAGAGKSAALVCMSLSLELGTDPLYCYQ